MNPLRSLLAWWHARTIRRGAELLAKRHPDVMARLSAASLTPTEPPPMGPDAPLFPNAMFVAKAGCPCALCTGKLNPANMPRLTRSLAQQIDVAMIGVGAGKVHAMIQEVADQHPKLNVAAYLDAADWLEGQGALERVTVALPAATRGCKGYVATELGRAWLTAACRGAKKPRLVYVGEDGQELKS